MQEETKPELPTGSDSRPEETQGRGSDFRTPMEQSRPAATGPAAPPPPILGARVAAGRASGGSGSVPPGRGGVSPAPRRGGTTIWWVLGGLGVVGLVMAAAVIYLVSSLADLGSGSVGFQSMAQHDELREVVLEPASSRNKIAVVDMQGVITSSAWDYAGNNLVHHIGKQLEQAGKDSQVRAVLLKIDSPGGEVLASDEIYKLLAEFQEEHDKPVVASMGTVAASGGYYVAAPCRWIVANELTITGSIGVIMQSYNWRALMEKIGVRPQVFKSGALKDMLSPDKQEADITAEERRIVQDLVNETFERFKSVIEEGRGLAHARNEDNGDDVADQGRELVGHWKDFADGRLLSGKEAWKLGFVDELGDFSVAVDRARKLAGIKDARLIQYLRPPSFGSLFRLLGSSHDARVEVDLGIQMPKLRTGLYFLAPHLVP
ncbi:MAG: signal peptide peptidase SppA [Limisphaerales bacterium]